MKSCQCTKLQTPLQLNYSGGVPSLNTNSLVTLASYSTPISVEISITSSALSWRIAEWLLVSETTDLLLESVSYIISQKLCLTARNRDKKWPLLTQDSSWLLYLCLVKKHLESGRMGLRWQLHRVVGDPVSFCLFPLPSLACGFHFHDQGMVAGYPAITSMFKA